MKVVVALLFFAALAATAPQEPETVDVEEILHNDRLFKKYFDCIMDRGKCTAEGKKFKETLPKVVDEGCATCTKEQKDDLGHIVKFMLENRKSDYEEFEKALDPKQTVRKMFA